MELITPNTEGAQAVSENKASCESYAPYQKLIDALLDKHATSVEFIDVRGVSGFTDAIIIATSRSEPNTRVLREVTEQTLDTLGIPYAVEGENSARWCLVDGGSVVVNIFSREGKAFYDLVKLWKGTPMISFENSDL